jgi:UDP-4-amino-4-deoxy-L-arabinose formyltransferase/UDP-glucuronic acid dehydrogenase (UDP-4-keto-hexauronic acid decarboxylating)
MKVILLGWCRAASFYVRALLKSDARVVLVVTGDSAPAGGSLISMCQRAGVPVEFCSSANRPEFVLRLRELAPDLILVAGWPELLRPPVRSVARIGTVNFHPSLLPDYRGKHPLFWAILRMEEEVGITVHHVTSAVDAGPILLQRPLRVSPGSTSESLAEDADKLGASLIPELLRMAEAGALPHGSIPEQSGSYFPPARPEDGLLDWPRPASELERLVRACRGVIDAHTFFGGIKLVVHAATVSPEVSQAAPGTVVDITDEGVRVACGQNMLFIRRWLFLDRLWSGRELAPFISLSPGSRLSHNSALARASAFL